MISFYGGKFHFILGDWVSYDRLILGWHFGLETNFFALSLLLENMLVQVRNNSEIIEIYAVCDLLENSQPIKFFDTSSN